MQIRVCPDCRSPFVIRQKLKDDGKHLFICAYCQKPMGIMKFPLIDVEPPKPKRGKK